MFKILGAISLLAILVGFFGQNVLGAELASMLVVGGAIVGSINVLFEFASWFFKK
jgi:hypothetical protein